MATYDYRDEGGALVFQVLRYAAPKDFRPRRPDGAGGWTWDLKGVRRVVYRLDELAEQRRAFFVEGERDVDALAALGLTATTTQGGAAAWRDEYAHQIHAAGVEEIVAIPDNDDAGRGYVRRAAAALAHLGVVVRILELPDLAPKGDVSDWLAAGHHTDELLALTEIAPVFDESSPKEPGAQPTDAPSVETAGDDHRVAWPDGAEFVAVAPRESGEGIHAEVTITLSGTVLSWGRLNLASTSMREGLVKKLREASPDDRWRDRLEYACRVVAERVRAGSPIIEIRPAPRPATDRDLIENVLPLHDSSMIFGDGDSGKGWLALTCAVALMTGHAFAHLRPTRAGLRTLYLDWEASEAEVAERVDALCRGAGISLPAGMLLYREMSRALADDAARLRSEIARHRVSVVIVDSMVPAAGSEPESADSTIRTLNALRSFTDTSRIVIAHVNRIDADKTSGGTRPWGSVFNRNLARATWEVKRATPDGDDLVLACYLGKRNGGNRGTPPWSLRYQFAGDGRVTVHDEPLVRNPELLAKATTWQQLHAALSNGPKSAETLALELDLNVKTVRKTLERRREMGHVINLPGSEPLKWALASRREVV